MRSDVHLPTGKKNMQKAIFYNQQQKVILDKNINSDNNIKNAYLKLKEESTNSSCNLNLWLDITDPNKQELLELRKEFDLDEHALDQFLFGSKKPQVRIMRNQTFLIVPKLYNSNNKTLVTEAFYFFQGRGWLVTIHSSSFDLFEKVTNLMEKYNQKITESSIHALFFGILSLLVDSYETLLTAVEVELCDFEEYAIYRPSKKTLQYVDNLSRQLIIMRRQFWLVRNVINSLYHIQLEEEQNQQNRRDVSGGEYIRVTVYDDLKQLIETVEMYQTSLNSLRELMVGTVALQQNDAMKVLTIFASVLLPITFITGIFGMNGMDLGYIVDRHVGQIVVFAVMSIISVISLLYFKSRGWFLQKQGQSDQFVRDINKSSYHSHYKKGK
jgi:magnesium transporter